MTVSLLASIAIGLSTGLAVGHVVGYRMGARESAAYGKLRLWSLLGIAAGSLKLAKAYLASALAGPGYPNATEVRVANEEVEKALGLLGTLLEKPPE